MDIWRTKINFLDEIKSIFLSFEVLSFRKNKQKKQALNF